MKLLKITTARRLPGRSYDDACGTAHALDLIGERWALLVIREGHEIGAKELKEHLKPFVELGHLSKWAIPSQIAVVTEIPKTSVGKLDKKRIRLDITEWQANNSPFLSTL